MGAFRHTMEMPKLNLGERRLVLVKGNEEGRPKGKQNIICILCMRFKLVFCFCGISVGVSSSICRCLFIVVVFSLVQFVLFQSCFEGLDRCFHTPARVDSALVAGFLSV